MASPAPTDVVIPKYHDTKTGTMTTHPSSLPTPPSASESMEDQLSPSKGAVRAPSPSPSCSSLSTLPTPSFGTPSNTTNQPPAKRRKLTFAEKESRRLEKEASEQRKAEEKAQKEAEKEVKDRQKAEERAKKEEEKRQRDIEKEQRRLVKEEKDKEKEAEKQKKDEEKAKRREEEEKKAKSQLRLNSFFVKPVGKDGGQHPPKDQEISEPHTRRNSSSSIMDHDQRSRSTSALSLDGAPSLSDYKKTFQPFFLQSHTILAPPCPRSSQEQSTSEYELTCSLDSHTRYSGPDTLSIFQGSEVSKKMCHRPNHQVKDIIARLQGTSMEPKDLTGSSPSSKSPLDLLNDIPMKCLKFAEDVRPPYIGTYSRCVSPRSSTKLRRWPFTRALPCVNYEYDSEAEWEEPGEGEDLDSEGEEEPESEDEEEMSGFVDDGDAEELVRKRRPVIGDLESSCTGICWEDQRGNVDAPIDTRPYTIMMIQEDHRIPIDPLSTKYWQPAVLDTEARSTTVGDTPGFSSGAMNPPIRVPLANISPSNVRKVPFSTLDTLKENQPASISPNVSKSIAPKMAKRVVSADVLEDFKAAVVGSDLTKAGLVEVLKKQFPKQSKDAIKDTLALVAVRQGRTESEKRWVLK